MTRYIKIPSLCYRYSKTKGLLNQVVFYYQLKTLSSDGFFSKGSIKDLQQDLPYKYSTIWRNISRLIKCKLMRKVGNGYQLVSYDEAFAILGFNLSPNGNRKGRFKINKIPIGYCELKHLKLLIAYLDIRDNLKYQKNKALTNVKSSQYTGTKLNCTKDKRYMLDQIVKDNTVQMIANNDSHREQSDFIELLGKSGKNKHFNPDITLSLKGICNILGLPNTSSAYKLVQQMCELGWLSSYNRTVFIGTTHLSHSEAQKKYGDSYSVRHGMLTRTISNKVKCLK